MRSAIFPYGLALLVGSALLTGCSSPANRVAMTPPAVTVAKQHPYSVQVQANGGSETSGVDMTNIANADLKAAIEAAIVQSRLFTSVVQGADGDYDLNVQIVSLRRPMIGGTLSVDLEAGWSLVKRSDRSVTLRKVITSSGSATFGDAFAFVTRLQMAVEAAARDNITQGLRAIAELPL